MENTVLKNNLAEDLEASGYIDEYDDVELSEELIADINLGFEQIERGEYITMDELKERLFEKYGIKF